MTVNRVMVAAGVITVVQAIIQMMFVSLGLAQFFCIIDFLRELPLLIYIRILYFHNPNACGSRINIGQSVDGIADQAFILMTRTPLPSSRTFVVHCFSLGLSVLWIITSGILMASGAKGSKSRLARWPWILVTSLVSALDVVAAITFVNDSFYTRTLSDVMSYVGGLVSGAGNAELSTAWAAWVMAIIYSRFVVFFCINLLLLVIIVIDGNIQKAKSHPQIEAPTPVSPTPPIIEPLAPSTISIEDGEPSIPEAPRIPRPGLSNSFRRMKRLLFSRKEPSGPRRSSAPDTLDVSPERSPRATVDDKKTVNFPVNLLSLPQRLESMIAEQQKRLDRAVIDTSGRSLRASQSLPHLASDTGEQPEVHRGRRGTAAELQGQLPWAYVPASAHRMRDRLPSDEDLPPVPLPDYTAIPTFRKACPSKELQERCRSLRSYLKGRQRSNGSSDVAGVHGRR